MNGVTALFMLKLRWPSERILESRCKLRVRHTGTARVYMWEGLGKPYRCLVENDCV